MSLWLARAEGKYLDLITFCNWALVDLYSKNKEPIENKDILKHALTKYNLGLRFNQEWDWIKTRADGRYKRELCYILESLNLAKGPTISSIIINDYPDFFKKEIRIQLSAFATGKKINNYIPTEIGTKLSKNEFCSKEWYEIISKQVLSYGYFIRYLDIIADLQKKKKTINLLDIQNCIGPINTKIIGGGPQFIQGTFKEWGFYLDIFDIETRTGNALKGDLEEKLRRLRKRIMSWKTNISPLSNVRNNIKFIIKREPIEPIRIPQFVRLILNWEWRIYYKNAVEISVRRALLILLLAKNVNQPIELNRLTSLLYKKMGINFNKKIIIDDLNYLSCAGIDIKINKEIITSKRKIDLEEFYYYLPGGKFFNDI